MDEIISENIASALSDFQAFPLKPILFALKQSPDGVKVGLFEHHKYNNVNLSQPKDVAVSMKLCDAIYYHQPSREYRLSSNAHKTAMKIYCAKDMPMQRDDGKDTKM